MKFDHRFRLSASGPSMRVYEADGVSMRLDFFAHMLRVALIRKDTPLLPTWSVCPDGNMPLCGRDKLGSSGVSGCRIATRSICSKKSSRAITPSAS